MKYPTILCFLVQSPYLGKFCFTHCMPKYSHLIKLLNSLTINISHIINLSSISSLQIFFGLQDILKKSFKHVWQRSLRDALKTFWRRLEDVFRLATSCLPRRTIFHLPRSLEDVLKMSLKTRNCHDPEKPFSNFF